MAWRLYDADVLPLETYCHMIRSYQIYMMLVLHLNKKNSFVQKYSIMWSYDRLISTIGFPVLVNWQFSRYFRLLVAIPTWNSWFNSRYIKSKIMGTMYVLQSNFNWGGTNSRFLHTHIQTRYTCVLLVYEYHHKCVTNIWLYYHDLLSYCASVVIDSSRLTSTIPCRHCQRTPNDFGTLLFACFIIEFPLHTDTNQIFPCNIWGEDR